MRIEHQRELPGSPAEVVALMHDEGFQRRKAERLGALDFGMDVTETERGSTVVTRRRTATTTMPEFVRAMVRATITAHETEEWGSWGPDGSRDGVFRVEVDGAPIGLVGGVRAEAAGQERCLLTFWGEVEARVPMFRERVARIGAGPISETIETEFRLLEECLRAGNAA
ncbi:DUF2505 domain-containing protein [Myceligenerans salitolerans]|uniref:DUF2505 domain-containing protein n=1 Tax=Myceligenerans salitolerans TaxID=1230528 RepID=A0ABS3IFM8_9MICO|nr:DUF2505 domain-containing protein [Myceligenerans salitolerans]MBO0611219.1 DUF2505 domain-containing protein [Myceligenerans salitolerans]